MRIACVGGGPAGLYFAILMKGRDPAHDITVFERNPPGVTYGWGVVFWDDLLGGSGPSDSATASVIRSNSFRWNGQLLAVEGKEPVHLGGHGYGIEYQRLLNILVERATRLGVRVMFETEIENADRLREADLIVACNSVNSRLRQLGRRSFRPTSSSAGTNTSGSGLPAYSTPLRLHSFRRKLAGSGVMPTDSTGSTSTFIVES